MVGVVAEGAEGRGEGSGGFFSFGTVEVESVEDADVVLEGVK